MHRNYVGVAIVWNLTTTKATHTIRVMHQKKDLTKKIYSRCWATTSKCWWLLEHA